jgi:GDP-mannose pyrophosphatase NudK
MIDKVKILKTEVLSDNWYVLRKITYEYEKKDGTKHTQSREVHLTKMKMVY